MVEYINQVLIYSILQLCLETLRTILRSSTGFELKSANIYTK